MTIAGIGHAPARGLAGALFCAAALLAAGAAAPARVAADQLTMTYVSNTTWTADPAEARVHVSSQVTATSHAIDVNGHRGFYSTLEMTLPRSIADVKAMLGDGSPRPVTVAGMSSGGTVVSVSLGKRLYAGQSVVVILKFDLVDPGGGTNRDIRIGHNIMSFPVLAFGTPETPGSSATVVFPSDFTVQEDYGSMTRSIVPTDEITFTSGPLPDANKLITWFTASQPVAPGDLRSRSIAVGGMSITLRYWVDDPGWADAVQSVLERGLPKLTALIGLGLPTTQNLTVIEATSQETGGYAGSFDVLHGEVQVSYLADPFVILHEAAHLWFNDALAAQRWIEEGFASYYAERAVLAIGLEPNSPQLDDRLQEAAVPFNDWLTAGVPNSATEKYLYAATLQVASEIVDTAGADGMRRIWQAAADGLAAYQPSPTARELQAGAIDWRRFLDLLENTTGQSFESIWYQWVVSDSQAPLMSQRQTTLRTYQQVEEEAGTWTLPPEIRSDLDNWHFEQADEALAQARVVLATREDIASTAAREGTSSPPTLRRVFETSTVQASVSEAAAELQALDAIAAAVKAQGGGSNGAGFLVGGDPVADLSVARAAFAEGNLQAATSYAQNAERIWQGGYSAELVRMAGLAVGSTGLLVLLAIGLWAFARRSRGEAFAGASGLVSTDVGAITRRPRWRTSDEDDDPLGPTTLPEAEDPFERIPILAASRRSSRGGSGRGDLAGGPGGEAGGPGREGGSRDGGGSDNGGSGNGDSAGGSADSAEPGDRGRGGKEGGGGQENREPEHNPFGPGFGNGHQDRGESAYELLQRGQALLRDRHNAQAAVVLERAARVEPGKGSILEALGRAYFNSGQHVRAAETFEALLEVDPSAHYGHFALGLSFARLGREQEARTHLRLAVALDPSSETYRRALERIDPAE